MLSLHSYCDTGPREFTNQAKLAVLKAVEANKGIFQPGRDDDIELLFLQDILRNLTALSSIVIRENNYPQSGYVVQDTLPAYYQRLTDALCGPLRDFHVDIAPAAHASRSTKRILVATHSLGGRIKNFRVTDAHWEHITAFERDGKHLDLLQPFIHGLKHLDLQAGFEGNLTPNFLMKNLGIVLNLATNLESLGLAFGITRETDDFSDVEEWNSDGGDDGSSSTNSLLELIESAGNEGISRWGTGLKKLSLTELRCSHSQLTKVLKRCAPTLKEFELRHLELFPENAIQSYYIEMDAAEPRPCFIQLFRDIRSILNLKKITLANWFRNTGRQSWIFSPNSHETSPPCSTPLLLQQLYDWILNKSDTCPLQPFAIPSGFLDVPEEQLKVCGKFSDASIQILGQTTHSGIPLTVDNTGLDTGWMPNTTLELPPVPDQHEGPADGSYDGNSPPWGPSDPPLSSTYAEDEGSSVATTSLLEYSTFL
jgi:hypothetical protein